MTKVLIGLLRSIHLMVKCPNCGLECENNGLIQHIRYSDCPEPSLSDRQREIVEGLLMSDGCVGETGLKVEMITKEFIEWIDDEMGIFSTGVSHREVEDKNRNDTWIVRLRNFSDIQDYKDWYSTGEKQFPDELVLTPLMTKVWYCGDGTWDGRPCFAVTNENAREDFVRNLFEKKEFETIWYSKESKKENEKKYARVTISQHQTRDFLDWMGEPLPGFDYKWGTRKRSDVLIKSQEITNYEYFDKRLGKGWSLQDMGDELGIKERTVEDRMKKRDDVSMRRYKPWRWEDCLRDMYFGESMSISQIAEELDCDYETIRRWLKRHEIT